MEMLYVERSVKASVNKENATPQISIVVPVYKVEEYIDRCVESLINQTMVSLEILLVDDGSPDRCPMICDEWAAHDPRIHVIHKENGGLSDARNTGIESASGIYVMFVDSDDYLASNACELLLDTAGKTGADLVCCNFLWDYGDYQEQQDMKIKGDQSSFSSIEITKCYFQHRPLWLTVAWNKLYRRDLFFTKDRIRFPIGRLHEDEFTAYRFLYASHKVAIISNPLYYYVQRANSIMAQYGERNVNDTVAYAMEYIPWAKRVAPHLLPWAEYATINSYMGLLMRCRNEASLDENMPVIRDYFQYVIKSTKCLIYRSNIDWKMKIKDVLLRMHLLPQFLSFMDRLKHI